MPKQAIKRLALALCQLSAAQRWQAAATHQDLSDAIAGLLGKARCHPDACYTERAGPETKPQ